MEVAHRMFRGSVWKGSSQLGTPAVDNQHFALSRQFPIGVLYDLLAEKEEQPWNLTVSHPS